MAQNELIADVLIIGGGPAGTWAALAAVQAGASVVIAEKGYLGTSGPMSCANTGIYYTKPNDPEQREAMVKARMPLAFGLAREDWGYKILDQSYANLQAMADWGFGWQKTAGGREYRGNLRGPNVMLFLRSQLVKAGVTILDHSPALELLTADGAAAGAAGVNRQTGESWQVRAGSVIVATGGTAFLSGAGGTGGLTGDGYLLAAEAGAEFSGMEFTAQYHAAPHGGLLSRGAFRENTGVYRDNEGNEIQAGRQMVKALLETGAAWDQLEKATDPEEQRLIRGAHAHSFLYFDRLGIDPFNQRYRVDFILEGSIRASGGIAIEDDFGTAVPGLYATGDVASREKLNGAGPPGGGPAAAWAFGSGSHAGRAAALFARRFKGTGHTRTLRSVGEAGLRPTGRPGADISRADIVNIVRDEMLPLNKNFYRTGEGLAYSLNRFDPAWKLLRESLAAAPNSDAKAHAREVVKAREAAALLAASRWVYRSAEARPETRGLHRRADFPQLDPAYTHHIEAFGIDEIKLRRRAVFGAQQNGALAS